ncbi:sensor histidine kinase [Fusibacter sp. JL216-2]|uniref:sensor histidine kinase n=1 Tax=Fusibacter sp. JL216-2 TaxID=3071453 RepID=UPI003D33341C
MAMMRGGGVIDIATREVAGGVEIIYQDDGKGMSQEIADKIFTPFFTTKQGEGGSGLGMHIVHTLVTEKFGGTIEVGPNAGKGVRFNIFLPKIKEEDSINA